MGNIKQEAITDAVDRIVDGKPSLHAWFELLALLNNKEGLSTEELADIYGGTDKESLYYNAEFLAEWITDYKLIKIRSDIKTRLHMMAITFKVVLE